jgi:hypothetical protein
MRVGPSLRFVVFFGAATAVTFGCSLTTVLSGLSDEYNKVVGEDGGGAGVPGDGDGQGGGPIDGRGGSTGGGGGDDSGVPRTDDGGRVPTGKAETLAMNQQQPMGIAVTETDIFWVTVKNTSFWHAPKVGGAPTNIPFATQPIAPFDVALEGGVLYWTEQQNVYSRPVNTQLRDPVGTGDVRAAFLAVAKGAVYFTDSNTTNTGRVKNRHTILFDNQGLTTGVAFVNGTLIWAHKVSGSNTVIEEASIGLVTASSATQLFSLGAASVQGLAADAKYVYWIADGKRIMRGDRTSKSMTILFESTDFGEGDIAVDDKYVYWSERNAGLIRRLALP